MMKAYFLDIHPIARHIVYNLRTKTIMESVNVVVDDETAGTTKNELANLEKIGQAVEEYDQKIDDEDHGRNSSKFPYSV